MKQPDLIDIGVNLTHSAFQTNLPDVLQRAAEQGVQRMIVTGTDIAESQAAFALTRQYPNQLFSTAGIHPHDAKSATEESWDVVSDLAQQPSVVAVGECGLDFNRDYSPRAVQEAVFVRQLALAAELNMPVFMHERDAHERFIAILKEFRPLLSGAVIHCFTGTEAELMAYLELDLHIGITGWICDERRGLHLQQAVKKIPANRLMLETDSPYLLPRDLRPKPKSRQNQPCYLGHIAERVAAAREQSVETLRLNCRETTERFFQLGH